MNKNIYFHVNNSLKSCCKHKKEPLSRIQLIPKTNKFMPLMSPFTNQQRYTSESVQKENQMYNILKTNDYELCNIRINH